MTLKLIDSHSLYKYSNIKDPLPSQNLAPTLNKGNETYELVGNAQKKYGSCKRIKLVTCSLLKFFKISPLFSESVKSDFRAGLLGKRDVILYTKVSSTLSSISPKIPNSKIKPHPSKFFSIPSYQKPVKVKGLSNQTVKTFLKADTTPHEISSFITEVLSERSATLIKSNDTFKTTACPTPLLIKKIASRYRKKYDVEIIVCSVENLHSELKALRKEKTDRPFGIIVSQTKRNHFLPLLCDFTNGKKDILNLEVSGKDGTYPYKEVNRICLDLNFNLIVHDGYRQADNGSCRTDALLILRNALLDIKLKQSAKTFTNLLALVTPTSHEKGIQYATLPVEWDYIGQISNPLIRQGNFGDRIIIRDQFSADAKKRKNPRTVNEFRANHTNQVTIINILKIAKEDAEFYDKKLQQVLALKKKGNLPPHISIKKTEKSYTIAWPEKRNINTYTIYKGFRYAATS